MGGELAELSAEIDRGAQQGAAAAWSHGNPIDILGDADPERYAKALEIAAKDPNSDGLLVILTPAGDDRPDRNGRGAERRSPMTRGKPVLASWMGGKDVVAGEAILNQAGIPTFAYPDTAARIFHLMWRYTYNLRGLYETPTLVAASDRRRRQTARWRRSSCDDAREPGRTLLTEFESKQLLAAYGIPTVATRIAASEDEAAAVRRRDRLSGRAEAPLARRSPTRPMSAACSSIWPTPTAVRAPTARSKSR